MNIAGLSMIVVDDDEVMLAMLRRALSGVRSFETFCSADDFVSRAKLDGCDLVLTDINMPGGRDGIELTRYIKRVSPLCDVVVMTGEATLDNALAALKAGAYDFLRKPFSVDYLESAVDRCVEKRAISAELRAMTAAREELSAAYSQLQASERMKDAFLSVIGHELRTPISKIIAGTELLKGSCEGMQDVLNAVTAGAADLNAVIESLIIYADLKKEAAPPSRVQVDIAELARAAVEELRPQSVAAGVRLAFEGAASAPVEGDSGWLRSAILRLAQNAVKFNSPGGSAAVRVEDGEDSVTIVVSDSGIGIPEELVSGVYAPFYQIAEHMTRSTGGLGLGLAIVKKVVDAHNGKLLVKSRPDKGTAFTVVLMKKLPAAAARGARA